ncbi:MAG: hypothetical protein KDC46_11600 [Thermoleophilia bacterium]|nr:hypothetical protein [Thermoleophilia bacterium]
MINAEQAFRYARGAMWHLEAAAPELRAAAGGASKAAELTAAAATHIESAVGDLASAAAHARGVAGVHDAAFSVLLSSTARTARTGATTPSAAAEIVAAARLRIQQSLDAIAPHLTADEQLLPLVPTATIPRSELALVDRVQDARPFSRVSDVQRAQIQRILADGNIDPEPIRWVGGYGNGNGAMPMVRVTHPDTPHLSVVAVQRPPTAQAAQEEFFARLAEHARVDQHFAPVARRADGSALVLAVPGGMSWEQGINSGDDIADVMGVWYRKRFPGLTDAQAQVAGRIDFDEARAIDFVAAQPDRNAGGILVDRSSGELHYIDNGFAGRGETGDVLRPGLKSHFVGGEAGHAELHPIAARELGANLTDSALADAHAILGRGPDGALPDGHAFALRQDASQGFLDAMRARRDQLETGFFDYEPIDLNANPLAHMDWLHQLNGPRSF